MKKRVLPLLIALLALGALSPGSSTAYDAVDVTGGGTLVGTVKFSGQSPEPDKVKVTRNVEVCGKEEKFDESLIVGSGGSVKNAVLYLSDIHKGKKLDHSSKVEMDQRGCQFHPHVLILPAGQSFDLLNSDGILHNFRTNSAKNPILNKAQPKFKKRLKIKIDKPEIIRVNCDVHEWMNAWVVVADHPYYALSDNSGAFALEGIPPGKYTLKLWHETLGEQTQQVKIEAGKESRVELTLKQP